jgi:Protein of unknown function (DUF3485)
MAPLETIAPETSDSAATPVRPRRGSALIWMVIGCTLLITSGVARSVQDRRHRVESSYAEACPFPLRSIPTTLGRWKMVGEEMILDSLTMRITGGTDHSMRTYVDELTGVTLVVLVLFGPAEPVIPHTPQVCYPSSGFHQVDDATDRVIESKEDQITSVFRSAAYAKSGGRGMLREGVYHSFRLEGQWSPHAGSGRKFPRRSPSVFKVQVQRRMADGERIGRNDPIEQFLSLLVPAIEREIKSAAKPAGTSAVGVGPSIPPGAPGDGLALATPGELRARDRPANRWPAPVSEGLSHPAHQHRGAPDHADDQEDGREVDRQGQLHGEADGIAGLAGAMLCVGQAPRGDQTLGTRNHRRHSLTSLDRRDSRLSPV